MRYTRYVFPAFILAAVMILFVRGAAADDAYLTATPLGPGSVLIEWEKGTPLSAYRIDVKRVVLSSSAEEDVTSMYMPPAGDLVSFVDTGVVEGTEYHYYAYAYNINGEYVGAMSTLDIVPLDLAVFTSSSFTRSGDWIHGSVSWLPVDYAQRYRCWIRVGSHDWIGSMDEQDSTVNQVVFPSTLVYDNDTVCEWVVISYTDGGEGPETTAYIGTFGSLLALPDSSAELEKPVLSAVPSGNYSIRLNWTASAGADSYTIYKGKTEGSMDILTDVTNQSTSYLVDNDDYNRCYRFTVAAWYDGVSALSNIAAAMAAPLPEYEVHYSADKSAGVLHARLVFDEYGDYKIRYGKSGNPLLGFAQVYAGNNNDFSADLTFPLPDVKTSYTFAVTQIWTEPYTDVHTYRDGPTARKTAVYNPWIFWYPGGSFVWEEIDLWPEPWNRDWIEDMLSAFARTVGTGETMEIGVRDLAGLARTLASGQEPGSSQLRMLGLFLPDFQRLLKVAGRFPPSEAEVVQLSKLFRGVKDLLAGRAPEKLRGADAERYKALLGDILELLVPAKQATQTSTPAATHPFKTRIPFRFSTPTPTPVVPR